MLPYFLFLENYATPSRRPRPRWLRFSRVVDTSERRIHDLIWLLTIVSRLVMRVASSPLQLPTCVARVALAAPHVTPSLISCVHLPPGGFPYLLLRLFTSSALSFLS